jgi:hypothetical protein
MLQLLQCLATELESVRQKGGEAADVQKVKSEKIVNSGLLLSHSHVCVRCVFVGACQIP